MKNKVAPKIMPQFPKIVLYFAIICVVIISTTSLIYSRFIQSSGNKTDNMQLSGSVDGTISSDNATSATMPLTDNFMVSPSLLTGTPEVLASITAVPTHTNKPTASPTAKPPSQSTKTITATPTPIPLVDYSTPRQVAANCPASTQACVPCTEGVYCRFEKGYTSHGFLGWACQNNNPGNIRPSDYRAGIIINNGGQPPCGTRTDSAGRGDYMVFSTYSAGYNALKAYLKGIAAGQHSAYSGTYTYVNSEGTTVTITQTCGECNLKFFSAKYSGTTNQEPSNSYANKIANRLGVDVNSTTLNYLVANRLDDLATAIQVNEGWFTK